MGHRFNKNHNLLSTASSWTSLFLLTSLCLLVEFTSPSTAVTTKPTFRQSRNVTSSQHLPLNTNSYILSEESSRFVKQRQRRVKLTTRFQRSIALDFYDADGMLRHSNLSTLVSSARDNHDDGVIVPSGEAGTELDDGSSGEGLNYVQPPCDENAEVPYYFPLREYAFPGLQLWDCFLKVKGKDYCRESNKSVCRGDGSTR